MGEKFKVIVDYQDEDGYVEYDADSKTVTVELADAEARQQVVDYLNTPHTINVAQTLLGFSSVVIDPKADIKSFQTALTRMWGKTGVLVQWSKPV